MADWSRLLPALALVGVPLMAGDPPSHASPGFGDPARGQSLFVSKGCVNCHAVRGAGGRIGPDLGRMSVKGSFYDIATSMWNHSSAMGDKMKEFRLPRPSFSGAELADLMAFLYFLNYFDEPGDPRTGKVLFIQKHCIQCHSIGKEGGKSGPRLDTLPRGTSPLRIAQDLWNHGPAMAPAIRRMGLDLPKFNGNEILDLFAYLRSQGQRQAVREFRSAGDPARGRQLFQAKGCIRCHGVHAKGTRAGPDLGRAELRGSVTQLAGRMWNHWPAMSEGMGALGMATPTFKGDDLGDVFAFLFVSRYTGEGGDPARGWAAYRGKGCIACHGRQGEGGIGPSLKTFRSEPKEQMMQRMWNHAPQMQTLVESRQLPWPRLEPGDLAGLFTLMANDWDATPPRPRR